MIHSFINQHGVYVFLNSLGVLLSYSIDGKEQIELDFSTLELLKERLQVQSLEAITGHSILSNKLNESFKSQNQAATAKPKSSDYFYL
ncbi:MAG: hypothetical protein EYC69_03645 [Bacteroidetes bacterium]|nr:MAG: hypothetical protein EYC69_03645 [Bacteroidota bacterium]